MFTVNYLLTTYDEKKKMQAKKTTVDIFLKKVTSPQPEPEAGSAGGAPEEDVVVIGDRRHMSLLLKAFHRDKMWKQK